jgi:hypothetical protein
MGNGLAGTLAARVGLACDHAGAVLSSVAVSLPANGLVRSLVSVHGAPDFTLAQGRELIAVFGGVVSEHEMGTAVRLSAVAGDVEFDVYCRPAPRACDKCGATIKEGHCG